MLPKTRKCHHLGDQLQPSVKSLTRSSKHPVAVKLQGVAFRFICPELTYFAVSAEGGV